MLMDGQVDSKIVAKKDEPMETVVLE